MTIEAVTFRAFVPGKPEPQGSTKAFNIPGRQYPVVTSDNPRLKHWRALAVTVMQDAMPCGSSVPMFRSAVMVQVQFVFPRLKAHPVRPGRSTPWMLTAPDLDKLLRAFGDALTVAGVIADDSLIVSFGPIQGELCMRRYADIGEPVGTTVSVQPMPARAQAHFSAGTEQGALL